MLEATKKIETEIYKAIQNNNLNKYKSVMFFTSYIFVIVPF